MKVKNRRCIRTLSFRQLKASKSRNLIAVFAIALTTLLFTSLFTIALSINDGFQQSNFRQCGGWNHGSFKYLTEEQFDQIKTDPLIQEWGLRRFVGMPDDIPFNKSHVEVGYSDATQAHWMYCDPIEGALPQEGTDQAATDTRVLELLGVEPELGAQFTVTFPVDGHTTTQTFTLCGWWEYDEAVVANHILIPLSRAQQIYDEVGLIPGQAKDGMTGSWNLDVMFKNSLNIDQNMKQVLANFGYQDESPADGDNYIRTGVNWGYSASQLAENIDPGTILAIAAMLLLIVFTGYLIIYNVFQISVANDIRFYGLLKTIGTTPSQISRMIRLQALLLSLLGIPLGLVGGWFVGGALTPVIISRQPGFPQPCHLHRFFAVFPLHRAAFLLPSRKDSRQGFTGGSRPLHRGQQHQAQEKTFCKKPFALLNGKIQPGTQPHQNGGHRSLPVAGCRPAQPHCHLYQWL